uniref:Uncharacterized protein n=1 Tax=Glossina brevipalpis TaxID=37001 RepID=A0A1A9W7P7_9MUSC
MSAAYIFSMKLNKLWKIRSSPMMMKKNLPITRNYNTIKRDLFGPINPVEIKKLFQEALNKNTEEDAMNFGTDFCLNSPLTTAYTPFIWKRIIGSKDGIIVPEMRSLDPIFFMQPPQKPFSSLLEENLDINNDANITDIDFGEELHIANSTTPFDFSEIRVNSVGQPEDWPPASEETLIRKKNQKK